MGVYDVKTVPAIATIHSQIMDKAEYTGVRVSLETEFDGGERTKVPVGIRRSLSCRHNNI